MKPSFVACAALVAAFGCVAPLDSDPERDSTTSSASQAPDVYDELELHPEICGSLPRCGACSLLCDPEQLAARYVPKGTCVLFQCQLVDTRIVRVDVCNP